MAKRSPQTIKANRTQVTPAASQPDKFTAPATTKNGADFIDEYYYVFTDMRFMLIATALMVVVAYGLSFIV